MTQVHETEALLLRRVELGETDLVLTLFTQKLGRISAIARGARRSTKRFGGALEPFFTLRVRLEERPRSELFSLSEASLLRPRLGLLSELSRLEVAGRALSCDTEEIALLASAGKGVRLIKLEDEDLIVGAQLLVSKKDELVAEKESGTELKVSLDKYKPVSRGGKGHALFQRGSIAKVVIPVPEVPSLPESK